MFSVFGIKKKNCMNGTKISFVRFTLYNILWHEGVRSGETLIQMFSIICGSVSVPVTFGLTFCVCVWRCLRFCGFLFAGLLCVALCVARAGVKQERAYTANIGWNISPLSSLKVVYTLHTHTQIPLLSMCLWLCVSDTLQPSLASGAQD